MSEQKKEEKSEDTKPEEITVVLPIIKVEQYILEIAEMRRQVSIMNLTIAEFTKDAKPETLDRLSLSHLKTKKEK